MRKAQAPITDPTGKWGEDQGGWLLDNKEKRKLMRGEVIA